MTEHIISVTHESKALTLKINGLYLFNGFEIMESFTEQMEECYYLFFYKDQFLTAHQTTKMKRSSALAEVLSNGTYIPAPSPIIHSLLAMNTIHTFSTLNAIWKTINQKFDDIEAEHILTIFDSYIKKDTILSLLEKKWTQLRRDGKLSQAFRILQLTLSRYPNNKWAKPLSSHLDYAKYAQKYQSDIKTLLTYDSILGEKQLFSMRNNKKAFTLLDAKLIKESRNIERTALYCAKLTEGDEEFNQYYEQLLSLLPNLFSKQEIASILYTIFAQSISTLNKEKVKNELLGLLAKNLQYEDTFHLLSTLEKPLSTMQIDIFIHALNHLPSSYFINFNDFKATLLVNANTEQLQILLAKLVPRLLNDHDIQFVFQWLQPLQASTLPIIEKINMMHRINDDPDQQHYLGEMYYQLNQLKQAVDCFMWDFELNPTNPRPIKWLSKLYRELGMKDEAESYMYLFKQIQKSS